MTDTELYSLCELCVKEIGKRIIELDKNKITNEDIAKEIEKRITELDKNKITNGDMIKVLFPNIRIIDMPDVEVVQTVNEENDIFWGESRNFHYTWWNAPYKKG